jgi:hypothetical protein
MLFLLHTFLLFATLLFLKWCNSSFVLCLFYILFFVVFLKSCCNAATIVWKNCYGRNLFHLSAAFAGLRMEFDM